MRLAKGRPPNTTLPKLAKATPSECCSDNTGPEAVIPATPRRRRSGQKTQSWPERGGRDPVEEIRSRPGSTEQKPTGRRATEDCRNKKLNRKMQRQAQRCARNPAVGPPTRPSKEMDSKRRPLGSMDGRRKTQSSPQTDKLTQAVEKSAARNGDAAAKRTFPARSELL